MSILSSEKPASLSSAILRIQKLTTLGLDFPPNKCTFMQYTFGFWLVSPFGHHKNLRNRVSLFKTWHWWNINFMSPTTATGSFRKRRRTPDRLLRKFGPCSITSLSETPLYCAAQSKTTRHFSGLERLKTEWWGRNHWWVVFNSDSSTSFACPSLMYASTVLVYSSASFAFESAIALLFWRASSGSTLHGIPTQNFPSFTCTVSRMVFKARLSSTDITGSWHLTSSKSAINILSYVAWIGSTAAAFVENDHLSSVGPSKIQPSRVLRAIGSLRPPRRSSSDQNISVQSVPMIMSTSFSTTGKSRSAKWAQFECVVPSYFARIPSDGSVNAPCTCTVSVSSSLVRMKSTHISSWLETPPSVLTEKMCSGPLILSSSATLRLMNVVLLPESTSAQHMTSLPWFRTRTRKTPRDALPLSLNVDATTPVAAACFLSSTGLFTSALSSCRWKWCFLEHTEHTWSHSLEPCPDLKHRKHKFLLFTISRFSLSPSFLNLKQVFM